ncbi:MAG: MFS transporter [Verrucomicrobia bacterium]|nr:MFS transporter [Verrucomicrobiota bacterium]MBU1734487.1 MFS transporter [Verrucomicrobiota bacterium]MBU1856049.1 MFS transporter [Verrucomicrobiota bacterium]
MKIYICPALMDALVFLVTFAVMYRAGEQGMSITQCAWMACLFQLTYMLTSLAAGFLLSRRNTRFILLAGIVLCTLCGVTCLMAKEFILILTAFGCMGIFMAFFFNAFQAFMRTESAPGNLKRAIGFYTLAWSLGSAAGIFSSGFFYRLGFTMLSALIVLVGVVMLVVLLTHKPRPANAPSADESVERGSEKAPPVDPIYVWIGWVMIFMAMFVQRPVHSFFPAISAKAGISAFVTGLPLFLQMTVQAVVGLAMIRWRHLLYRRTPLGLAHGGAAVLLLVMWRWPTLPVCFLGISLLGAYAGFIYFCSVYYASNSGRRALNIGVNEFLVGLGSFAGLFISEWVMKRTGNDANMYLVIAVALLISLAAQLAIASWLRRVKV